MVRVVRQEQSEDERLDGLIAQLAQKHGSSSTARAGRARRTISSSATGLPTACCSSRVSRPWRL
jgi:hypothetical protein